MSPVRGDPYPWLEDGTSNEPKHHGAGRAVAHADEFAKLLER